MSQFVKDVEEEGGHWSGGQKTQPSGGTKRDKWFEKLGHPSNTDQGVNRGDLANFDNYPVCPLPFKHLREQSPNLTSYYPDPLCIFSTFENFFNPFPSISSIFNPFQVAINNFLSFLTIWYFMFWDMEQTIFAAVL